MARMSRWAFLGCLLLAANRAAADDLRVQAGTTQTQPARPTEPPTTPTRPVRPGESPAERPTSPATPPGNRDERQPEANRPPESSLNTTIQKASSPILVQNWPGRLNRH